MSHLLHLLIPLIRIVLRKHLSLLHLLMIPTRNLKTNPAFVSVSSYIAWRMATQRVPMTLGIIWN